MMSPIVSLCLQFSGGRKQLSVCKIVKSESRVVMIIQSLCLFHFYLKMYNEKKLT